MQALTAPSSLRPVAEIDHDLTVASCRMHKIAIAAVKQTVLEAIFISLPRNRRINI